MSTISMRGWWQAPVPTDDERHVYYGLWDMLTDQAKATVTADQAQRAYGLDTMKAISLLFDLVRADQGK